MTIELKLQGSFITFAQDDVMLGESRLALLADVDQVITIEPNSHARIQTPICFKGDGKTIALIDMHAGKLSHALGNAENEIVARGEYFLPGMGEEAFVYIDVVNETGATLMIRPNTQLGILTFINLGAAEEVAPVADDGLSVVADFNPLFIDIAARPAFTHNASNAVSLAADLPEDVQLAPGASVVVPTGLTITSPAGFEGQLRPSSNLPETLIVQNRAPAAAGEETLINVALTNIGTTPVTIGAGDTIAQLVFAPVARASLNFTAADTGSGANRQSSGR